MVSGGTEVVFADGEGVWWLRMSIGSECFRNLLLIKWDFLSTFRPENGPKKEKQFLVRGSCVEDQNLLSAKGQRSEWADWTLISGAGQIVE